MIIDTHCHYNLSPLLEQWQKHWQTAQEKNVIGSMVVGTSIETSRSALDIADTQSCLFPSIGIHPSECHRLASWEQALVQLHKLSAHKKIIAVGECGLDYFRLPEAPERQYIQQLQKKVLTEQLKLAQEVRLPLIIHLRDKTEDAYWDFLEIFKSIFSSEHPFILHCVSGPKQFVQECVQLGAYVGVAGNITYPNSDHIRELVSSVPRERVLAETDAPFLPPQEARGGTCEPWMIQWTVEYLKNEYNLKASDLVKNTISLFPQFRETYEAIRNT